MPRPWRYSLGTVLLAIALVGVAIAGWTKAERLRAERDELASLIQAQEPSPHDAYLRGKPLTIVMSDENGMRIDGNWHAVINSVGDGFIETRNLMDTQHTTFTVPEAQLTPIREALISEEFFDLPHEVGSHVPCGGAVGLTFVVGERSKSVSLLYFGNMANTPANYPASELQEAARALRLWLLARDLVSGQQPFQGRPYVVSTLAKLDSAAGQPAPPQSTTSGSTAK